MCTSWDCSRETLSTYTGVKLPMCSVISDLTWSGTCHELLAYQAQWPHCCSSYGMLHTLCLLCWYQVFPIFIILALARFPFVWQNCRWSTCGPSAVWQKPWWTGVHGSASIWMCRQQQLSQSLLSSTVGWIPTGAAFSGCAISLWCW